MQINMQTSMHSVGQRLLSGQKKIIHGKRMEFPLKIKYGTSIFQKDCIYLFTYLLTYLFIYREREREGEREGKKHQCVVASQVPPTRDLACNPDMCPDWESNQQSFTSQAGIQSTKPHQPGLELPFDLVIPLLGIYLKKTKTQTGKYIYTPMFISALFTLHKTWKQPMQPSMHKRIKKIPVPDSFNPFSNSLDEI